MSSNSHLQHAFIDEHGDPSLDVHKEGVSNLFIVSAVIVDDISIKELEICADEIRKRHFQSGEMKSSKVGKNDDRRIRILKDIAKLNFHFYSLVVDKKEIWKDSGLRHKKSFLKFINGQLYKKLYRTFPDLRAVADEHGHSEFMVSFEAYIKKNHIPDLFYRAEFNFESSQKQPLIQLADFISGTIARVYDHDKKSDLTEKFIQIIKDQALLIEEWPPKFEAFKDEIKRSSDTDSDRTVREQSLIQAKLFLERNGDSLDFERNLQVSLLKFLLFQYKFINSENYITTNTLLAHLHESNFGDISEHTLRSKIIAPLRDDGVIIASSTKGYKIPVSMSDITDFVNRTNGIILPMLNRLNTARNQILMASKNNIDIVEQQQFKKLKSFLDS
jgi:hypothetical protein